MLSRVVRVWEKTFSNYKREIAEVPWSVNMRELVKDLRVRNSIVKRVERMMRGVEKKETNHLDRI